MPRFHWVMTAAVLEGWVRRAILRQAVPAALHVELTSRCQLACEGCYAGAAGEGTSWSAPALDRLVGEAEGLGIRQFSLTGGEPLLEVATVLSVARSRPRSAFVVVTNGLAVDEELSAGLAEVGNVGVFVSHDGALTDRLRGGGVRAAAEAAMARLGRAGVFVGTSVRVSRETAPDVLAPDFVGRLAALGASMVVFAPLLPGRPGLTALSDDERGSLPRLVSRLGLRARLRAVVPCGRGEPACAGGALVAALAADGRAMPCPHIRSATHRWPEASLRSILDSPFFRDVARPREPEGPGRSCLVLDRADELGAVLRRHGADCVLYSNGPTT